MYYTYIDLTELYVWNERFDPEQGLNTDGTVPWNHNLRDKNKSYTYIVFKNGNIVELHYFNFEALISSLPWIHQSKLELQL